MTGERLKAVGQALYGYGWQGKMAKALRVNRSTIRRWIYAGRVPGPAAAALECFQREAKAKAAKR